MSWTGGGPPAGRGVAALVLGSAQDGGVPHAGCDCRRCLAALEEPGARRLPACLGLADFAAGTHWLVDATPALPRQWGRLRGVAPCTTLGGILLTHLHMGHYTGLVHLGPEAANTTGMPVYATPGAWSFLESNAPWRELIAGGHLARRTLTLGRRFPLSPDLGATAFRVPHRGDHGDTVAYLFDGPKRRLFWCPDVDGWQEWDRGLRAFLTGHRVDIALVDGTFSEAAELPGRSMADVPHPLAADTAARVAGLDCEVGLVHLNHTNRLLDDGEARAFLAAQGVTVAREGDCWNLASPPDRGGLAS